MDSDFGLCGPCWRDTAFIGDTICDGCGVPLPGGDEGETLQCDACLDTPRLWAHGRAAILYKDTGRKLVLSLKHGDRQEVAEPAGRWMSQAVEKLVTEKTLIVPVPLHWQRLLKRRHNQSALLAKALAKRTKLACSLDMLQRTKRTRSLDGLGREDRMKIVEKAIRVNPKRQHKISGRSIMLVDDVMTTGATLTASTRACLESGSGPVCVVTLARAVKDA